MKIDFETSSAAGQDLSNKFNKYVDSRLGPTHTRHFGTQYCDIAINKYFDRSQ